MALSGCPTAPSGRCAALSERPAALSDRPMVLSERRTPSSERHTEVLQAPECLRTKRESAHRARKLGFTQFATIRGQFAAQFAVQFAGAKVRGISFQNALGEHVGNRVV